MALLGAHPQGLAVDDLKRCLQQVGAGRKAVEKRGQSRPDSRGWSGRQCWLGTLHGTALAAWADADSAALLAAIGSCYYLPRPAAMLVKCWPAAVIDRRRPALWSCCACRSSACPAAWRIRCSISWRARWAAQLLLLSCFRPLLGGGVGRCAAAVQPPQRGAFLPTCCCPAHCSSCCSAHRLSSLLLLCSPCQQGEERVAAGALLQWASAHNVCAASEARRAFDILRQVGD